MAQRFNNAPQLNNSNLHQAIDKQWHKLCAMLVHKLANGGPVTLTANDMRSLEDAWRNDGGAMILAQPVNLNEIELRLISGNEAQRMQRERQGTIVRNK